LQGKGVQVFFFEYSKELFIAKMRRDQFLMRKEAGFITKVNRVRRGVQVMRCKEALVVLS
jgi:hypothetical protein